jgi:iron complex outermembrane receptor protein
VVDNKPLLKYHKLMRRIAIALLAMTLIAGSSSGEDSHNLGKIVVTPSRIVDSSGRTARSVTVLDDKALEASGWDNFIDKINDVGGIDIRRRGIDGVQADVDIRGATFEQNTVLIDGIVVNDPQTGHYTMDLPVNAADIDRIEIMKGPASSVYGANSFGGVIHVVTKRAQGPTFEISGEGGSYDYDNAALSVSYPFASINNRFSIEQSRSTGYMPETEFNILSVSDKASIDTFLGSYDFFFGYMKKDFGADSFYSNLFPNEEEHTDTRFFKIDGTAEAGSLKIMPKLFLRRHWDKFALDRNRPGWQTNYHTTYTYGGEIDCVLANPFMDTAFGFKLSRDTIDSTSMQTHARTNNGVYIEMTPKIIDELYLNAGLRQDYYSDFGLQYSPSVSLNYDLKDGVSARFSAGRSYRVPTFTDLYYADSGNIGNPSLRPESSWTYETGMSYSSKTFFCSGTYFYRETLDAIDWTRATARNRWQATNIGSTATNGAEAALKAGDSFVSYTVLDTYAKHDYISKYALDYLKQQLSCGTVFTISGFRNSWVFNFKKRIGDSGYITVDTRLVKGIIKKGALQMDAFFEITNLFDADYSEQSNIPMPGRMIRSGGKLKF